MMFSPLAAPAICLLAYGAIVGGWIGHCYRAMEVSHPWLDPMPIWRKVAYDPSLVLFATSPILFVLITWMVFTSAMAMGVTPP